jgi:hypothetical protein
MISASRPVAAQTRKACEKPVAETWSVICFCVAAVSG